MYNGANDHFFFFIWPTLPQVIELVLNWKRKAVLETELEKIGDPLNFMRCSVKTDQLKVSGQDLMVFTK